MSTKKEEISIYDDWNRLEVGFEMLIDAEVIQEFDDSVWIKVDKESWDQFQEAL
jgi:hypothetical protein